MEWAIRIVGAIFMLSSTRSLLAGLGVAPKRATEAGQAAANVLVKDPVFRAWSLVSGLLGLSGGAGLVLLREWGVWLLAALCVQIPILTVFVLSKALPKEGPPAAVRPAALAAATIVAAAMAFGLYVMWNSGRLA